MKLLAESYKVGKFNFSEFWHKIKDSSQHMVSCTVNAVCGFYTLLVSIVLWILLFSECTYRKCETAVSIKIWPACEAACWMTGDTKMDARPSVSFLKMKRLSNLRNDLIIFRWPKVKVTLGNEHQRKWTLGWTQKAVVKDQRQSWVKN